MAAHPETLAPEQDLEPHRRALTGYCYRMLGSGFDAEDAVQETFLRAWRSPSSLKERAALKSWLYRIATNVCLDMLQGTQRRARPMDLNEPATADSALGAVLPETAWVLPAPDARVLPDDGDPAELAAQKETIRLAFVAALQHLPPKQRAVLILREVLRWQASEVAELLDTSVASVNSALQRARATLDERQVQPTGSTTVGAEHRDLLAKYVDAFERYDISQLVTLLHDDATFDMPPFPLWLVGPEQVGAFMLGQGAACRGSRTVLTQANGDLAYASYKPTGTGVWEPWSIVLVESDGTGITAIHNFLQTELFAHFGLPARLED